MVKLAIVPHRGNHTRAYPYTGHLGLTPVTVHGQLSTILEEDRLPLEASSVIVRVACYEGDIAGPKVQATNAAIRRLYEVVETVWRAPEGVDYAPLGDMERSFRLTIPVDAKEHGAVSTLSFKTWRIWWLVEAVVFHRPAPLFGSSQRKSHPLLLINHWVPHFMPIPIWRGPNERLLLCKATVNAAVCGAGDAFTLRLDLRKRSAAPTFAVRRITVELRRVITRRGASLEVPAPLVDELPPTPPYEDRPEEVAAGSDAAYFGLIPAMQSKREETTLLSLVEEEVSFGPDGRWNGTLEGILPRHRTAYHYSVGETVEASCLTMKCYVIVKIVPVDKAHPILELQPTEIHLSALSREDRDIATAEMKRIAILQDAERRLFEPDDEGGCRATKKRLSVSSESAATRRRTSDAESEPDEVVSRHRFRSTEVSMSTRSRDSSRESSLSSSAAPPLQKLSMSAIARARLSSLDFTRSSISPVPEDDGTPRLGNAPTMLRRPLTPPSDDNDEKGSGQLFDKFAGFHFTTELSPPMSPSYSMTSNSTSGSKEIPLSPHTTASRAIPTLLYSQSPSTQSLASQNSYAERLSITRVYSHDASIDGGGKTPGGSKGLARFFRRTVSRS